MTIKLIRLTVIALISDSWPENVCLHIPSLISQSWRWKNAFHKQKSHSFHYSNWICINVLNRSRHHNKSRQTLAEASHAPDTNVLMSGDKDKLITSPVWPVKAVVCWPVSISHRALKTEWKSHDKSLLHHSRELLLNLKCLRKPKILSFASIIY